MGNLTEFGFQLTIFSMYLCGFKKDFYVLYIGKYTVIHINF